MRESKLERGEWDQEEKRLGKIAQRERIRKGGKI